MFAVNRGILPPFFQRKRAISINLVKSSSGLICTGDVSSPFLEATGFVVYDCS